MTALSDILGFIAGTPARIGLLITALTIFLTSNWRLSLSALLAQYILVGLVLYNPAREVALVKMLVGVLAVVILYLGTQRTRIAHAERGPGREGFASLTTGTGRTGMFLRLRSPWLHSGETDRWLWLREGWLAGPLGFPLRLLSVSLMLLALVSLFRNYRLEAVPRDVAQLAAWLAGMGIMGLILSGDPLRLAAAVLTILAGFDLLFTVLEGSLAVAAFFAAFQLVVALAFSYLVVVHSLAASHAEPEDLEEP